MLRQSQAGASARSQRMRNWRGHPNPRIKRGGRLHMERRRLEVRVAHRQGP